MVRNYSMDWNEQVLYEHEPSCLPKSSGSSPERDHHGFIKLYPNSHNVSMTKFATSTDSRGYIPGTMFGFCAADPRTDQVSDGIVYEFAVNENTIMIDTETAMVHFTGIWKALGHHKADVVKLIESQPGIAPLLRKVRGGFLKIQGTWLPYEIAKELARRVAWDIRHELIALFGPTFPSSCLAPGEPGFGQLLLSLPAAKVRNARNKNRRAAAQAAAAKALNNSDVSAASQAAESSRGSIVGRNERAGRQDSSDRATFYKSGRRVNEKKAAMNARSQIVEATRRLSTDFDYDSDADNFDGLLEERDSVQVDRGKEHRLVNLRYSETSRDRCLASGPSSKSSATIDSLSSTVDTNITTEMAAEGLLSMTRPRQDVSERRPGQSFYAGSVNLLPGACSYSQTSRYPSCLPKEPNLNVNALKVPKISNEDANMKLPGLSSGSMPSYYSYSSQTPYYNFYRSPILFSGTTFTPLTLPLSSCGTTHLHEPKDSTHSVFRNPSPPFASSTNEAALPPISTFTESSLRSSDVGLDNFAPLQRPDIPRLFR